MRPPIPEVLVVLGTRPEATKMAPVVDTLRATAGIRCRLVSTGQHRELLASALDDLGLTVDLDLSLMRPGQTAACLVADALAGIAALLREERPQMVLVHGDTGTACAAAMAGYLEGVPVGHVEAGLRSGSLQEPFPEEGNRRVIDTLSQVLWAPTERAAAALHSEGLGDRVIEVTGNTAIDCLLRNIGRARAQSDGLQEVPEGGRVVLVTVHRREAFGEPLRALCAGLRRVVDLADDLRIVFPVHLNPQVDGPVRSMLAGHPRIHLLQPLPYLSFLALMDRAWLILTDSGGIQEEAPALDKPVLVLRDRTERHEAVEAGTVRLVGTSSDRLVEGVSSLLTDAEAYGRMAAAENPFGDGLAAGRIVASVCRFLRI